jgi:hypothetical protein
MNAKYLTTVPALAALLLAAGLTPPADGRDEAKPAALPTLDQALRENAGAVLKKVKEAGYKNVGVLKFLAGNEGGEARDNLGSINYSLPDRLEVALILADDDGLGIVSRANAAVAAARNPRLTHRTPRGREEFYTYWKDVPLEGKTYPFQRAWGQDPIAIDNDFAFLTGEAVLSKDLRSLTVKVQMFGPRSKLELVNLVTFKAATDLRTLAESGASYASRNPLKKVLPKPIDEMTAQEKRQEADAAKQLVFEDALKSVPRVDDDRSTFEEKAEKLLKKVQESPVTFQIVYTPKAGGKEEIVPIEINPFRPPSERDNLLLRVREPKETEKVSFRLKNNDKLETFGVVLKVNGRNTIFPDDARDTDDVLCYKWILKPGDGVEVFGFQMDKGGREDFVVQSEEEARKDGMRYTEATGTFSLTIFRETTLQGVDPIVFNDAKPKPDVMVGRGGQFVSKQGGPNDLAALRNALTAETDKVLANENSRGVIGKGGRSDNPVREVKFKSHKYPDLKAEIRYFTPARN